MALLGTWPSVVDDSGLKTDGTKFNKALTDAFKAAIEENLHSTTNSSVKAKDIIDEVVAARGNLASLDARISGVIDDDGALGIGSSGRLLIEPSPVYDLGGNVMATYLAIDANGLAGDSNYGGTISIDAGKSIREVMISGTLGAIAPASTVNLYGMYVAMKNTGTNINAEVKGILSQTLLTGAAHNRSMYAIALAQAGATGVINALAIRTEPVAGLSQSIGIQMQNNGQGGLTKGILIASDNATSTYAYGIVFDSTFKASVAAMQLPTAAAGEAHKYLRWDNGTGLGGISGGQGLSFHNPSFLSTQQYVFGAEDFVSGALMTFHTLYEFDTVKNMISLRVNRNAAPAAGFGAAISFNLRGFTAGYPEAIVLEGIWTTTQGNDTTDRDAAFLVKTMSNGALQESWRFDAGGNLSSALGKGGFMEIKEINEPANGAANTARIYAKDNGAGKTQLMVRFASGASVELGIEP